MNAFKREAELSKKKKNETLKKNKKSDVKTPLKIKRRKFKRKKMELLTPSEFI